MGLEYQNTYSSSLDTDHTSYILRKYMMEWERLSKASEDEKSLADRILSSARFFIQGQDDFRELIRMHYITCPGSVFERMLDLRMKEVALSSTDSEVLLLLLNKISVHSEVYASVYEHIRSVALADPLCKEELLKGLYPIKLPRQLQELIQKE